MSPHPRHTAPLALAVAVSLALTAGCASGPGPQQQGPGAAGSTGTPIESSGQHQLRQVTAKNAPQVELTAAADAESGWNLHLATKRFRFTPEQVNQQVTPNAGHAHLYVDGEKLTRIYGPWFHLPPDMLPEGGHTLTVHLNANDHSAWAVNGTPVSDTTTVANTGEIGEHPGHGGHEAQDS